MSCDTYVRAGRTRTLNQARYPAGLKGGQRTRLPATQLPRRMAGTSVITYCYTYKKKTMNACQSSVPRGLRPSQAHQRHRRQQQLCLCLRTCMPFSSAAQAISLANGPYATRPATGRDVDRLIFLIFLVTCYMLLPSSPDAVGLHWDSG